MTVKVKMREQGSLATSLGLNKKHTQMFLLSFLGILSRECLELLAKFFSLSRSSSIKLGKRD